LCAECDERFVTPTSKRSLHAHAFGQVFDLLAHCGPFAACAQRVVCQCVACSDLLDGCSPPNVVGCGCMAFSVSYGAAVFGKSARWYLRVVMSCNLHLVSLLYRRGTVAMRVKMD
jgi:hypothetical protein